MTADSLPTCPAANRLLADPALSPVLARFLRLWDAYGRKFDDFDAAERVCTAVAREAADAGDEVCPAAARRVVSEFTQTRGDLMGALHQCEVAVAATDHGSAEVTRTLPRQMLGWVLSALDRFGEALEILGLALSEAQLHSRALVPITGAWRALVLLWAGRVDEALTSRRSHRD